MEKYANSEQDSDELSEDMHEEVSGGVIDIICASLALVLVPMAGTIGIYAGAMATDAAMRRLW